MQLGPGSGHILNTSRFPTKRQPVYLDAGAHPLAAPGIAVAPSVAPTHGESLRTVSASPIGDRVARFQFARDLCRKRACLSSRLTHAELVQRHPFTSLNHPPTAPVRRTTN